MSAPNKIQSLASVQLQQMLASCREKLSQPQPPQEQQRLNAIINQINQELHRRAKAGSQSRSQSGQQGDTFRPVDPVTGQTPAAHVDPAEAFASPARRPSPSLGGGSSARRPVRRRKKSNAGPLLVVVVGLLVLVPLAILMMNQGGEGEVDFDIDAPQGSSDPTAGSSGAYAYDTSKTDLSVSEKPVKPMPSVPVNAEAASKVSSGKSETIKPVSLPAQPIAREPAPVMVNLSEQDIKKFLNDYCVTCHNEDKRKGDHQYDDITMQMTDEDTAIRWQEALDQLNLGEMPPSKAKAQPSKQMVHSVVSWLTARLDAARKEVKPVATQTVLRRLSRTQYRYTLEDLLAIDTDLNDPTQDLPKDQVMHFDTTAEELVTSGYLLKQYLNVTGKLLDKALVMGPKPQVEKQRYNGEQLTGLMDVRTFPQGFAKRRFTEILSRDEFTGRLFPRKPVPVSADGTYEVKIEAQGINLGGKTGIAKVTFENAENGLNGRVGAEILAGQLEVTSNVKTYTLRAKTTAGFAPVIYFLSGARNNNSNRILQGAKGNQIQKYKVLDKAVKTPRLRVFSIEVRGPFYDQWPPESTQKILGQYASAKSISVGNVIKNFAERAYRQPVETGKIAPIAALVRAQTRKLGNEEAVKLGIKAMLCSPDFLYIYQNEGELDNYALANRLSYFLYHSMPDEDLFEAAKAGQLTDKNEIERQAERMMSNPRFMRFVRNFCDQWLGLDHVQDMPPDPDKFKRWYSDDLQKHSFKETYLSFKRMVERNTGINEMIDSNKVFVNAPLARHYGLKGVNGSQFREVKLPAGDVRGGFLTHASILTASANGVDTSPVIRGVWMLENFLGTPPTPPPPDVDPLDPDTRGAATIRDQLKKHREIATCNECHRKIDPYGFAFENFDATGQWRTRYPRPDGKKGKRAPMAKVDASGTLSTGDSFNDIKGLKKILLKRRELVAFNLTKNMLTFATGREMGFADRGAIEQILRDAAPEYGVRDLLLGVVTSEPFLNK